MCSEGYGAFFALQANGIPYGKQNSLTLSELFKVCVLPKACLSVWFRELDSYGTYGHST